jgi:phosphoglycolate phosphatase-like HAD superfamily hydrolase
VGPGALFFDVDGVLIDSVDIKGDCFVEVFSDYPAMKQQVRSWHEENGGVNREDKIRAISREVIEVEENPDQLSRRVKRYANLVVTRVILAPEIPGASLALTRLKGKIPLFATSATPQVELKRILVAREVDNYFTEIFGWPVTKKAAIDCVMEKYSFYPDASVLIGDSIQDFESAQSAGVRFVLVTGQTDNRICEADAYIKDLTTLPTALEHLASTR